MSDETIYLLLIIAQVIQSISLLGIVLCVLHVIRSVTIIRGNDVELILAKYELRRYVNG